MASRSRLRALCVFVLSLPLFASVVRAEDDWSLTREPQRPRPTAPRKANPTKPPVVSNVRAADPIERAYRALLSDPEDGFALTRLRELWLSREGSLDGLVKRLEQERVSSSKRAEVVLAQARVLALIERIDDALALLSELPEDTRAVLLRARLLRDAGRKDEARAAYEMLRGRAQKPAEKRVTIVALAELALDGSDLEGARALYQSLDNDAQNPPLYLFAQALAKRGEHAQAARIFRELAEQRRGDIRSSARYLRESGIAYLAAREDAAALEVLEQALHATHGASERAEIYDALIEAHRRLQRLPELAKALEKDSLGGAEAMRRAARLWDELSDEAKAVAAYQRALALSPRDLDLRRGLSQLYLRSGKLDESIAEQRALAKLAPDDPAVVVGLAKLLREVGKANEAQAVLDAAARAAPRSLMLHRALSELYALWGDSPRAQAELALLARLDPDDTTHIVALGSERFERGDRDGAIAVWNKLLERGGSTAEAESELSMVLADHDLLDLALTHAQKAAGLEPKNPSRSRDVAVLLERLGQNAEAEGLFRMLLTAEQADEPLRREARQHLVGLWTRSGALRGRVIDLQERFRRDPKDVTTGKLLAEAYARDPSAQGARAEQQILEQLVALDPKDEGVLRALERAATRRGDIDRALQVLALLVAVAPQQASATLKRAVELALSSYRDEDALRFARRAVEISPRDPKAHKLLGDLERKRSNLEGALSSYERSLALDSKDFETALAVAQLRLARGEHELAEQRLFAVLEGAADDDVVRRAASLLLDLSVAEERMNTVEPKLLELAIARSDRPLFRKLLIEAYGVWLSPLLAQRGDGQAAGSKLGLLGQRALKPLLEALGDTDPAQRSVALSLLGVLGNRAAAAPLLAVAENAARTDERAQALIAAGQLAAPESEVRLRALLANLEGRLRPLALWALLRCASSSARPDLLALTSDDDGSVRMMVALGLGVVGSGQDREMLKTLAKERNPNVRAAALLALAWHADTSLVAEAAQAVAPVWQVALSVSASEAQTAGATLFSPDPEQRAFATKRIGRALPERSLAALPVPSWPFHARDYVLSLFDSTPHDRLSESMLAALDEAFVARLAGNDAEVAVALSVLAQVQPRAGGARCDSPFLARPRIVAGLRELATRAPPSMRRDVLALLVRARASDAEVVLLALERGPTEERLAIIEELARSPVMSEPVRSRLLTLARNGSDWPTRFAAVRALEGRVPALSHVLEAEPYAIIRDAASLAPVAKPVCGVNEPASVN